MNNLKFNAWDGKKMLYDVIPYGEMNGEPTIIEVYEYENDIIIVKNILQFTGLHDAKGVALYDGDICKNGDWEDNAHAYNYRINVIEWDEHNAMWMGWNPNIDGMTCEKIGTMFNNPELLEQK